MKETKLNKDQIPINFSFIAEKSFDNFVLGKNNIAIDLLKDLAITNRTNIVFIRGNHSSGKTHLCLAVNNLTNINNTPIVIDKYINDYNYYNHY